MSVVSKHRSQDLKFLLHIPNFKLDKYNEVGSDCTNDLEFIKASIIKLT